MAVLLLLAYAAVGLRFGEATEVPDPAEPTTRPSAPAQAPRVPGTIALAVGRDVFVLREGRYEAATSESRNAQPELSRDGETLYFVRDESIDGRRVLPDGSVVSARLYYSNIVRKPARGGPETIVLDGLRESANGFHGASWHLGPAVSPDGERLAYIEDDGIGAADLEVLDLEREALTILSRGSQLADPAWAPDGETIAVTTYTLGQPGILLVPVDGTRATRLEGLPDGEPYAPSYSADGRWLLYTLRTDRGNDLHAVELDSGRDVALTDDGRSWHGVFSPDGRWIAFLRAEGGVIDLYAMELHDALVDDGGPGVPLRLTDGEGVDGASRPAWGG
ncbi:MAG TPA: hypothetical protein VMJ92_01375 [Candidatus Limnocylindrales bacterium]|nr:hypothetical protein [Candidatus Limnocylindrales bacterium]